MFRELEYQNTTGIPQASRASKKKGKGGAYKCINEIPYLYCRISKNEFEFIEMVDIFAHLKQEYI